MNTVFHSNLQFELAFDYVRNTATNIFLTGKAGTGKTTFLHQLRKECPKRMVVVAPTGVSAINAGGMTIHTLFQLPFGPYVPGAIQEINRQRRFTQEKIRLLRSIDLLVIDEVSMVRPDTLDAVDDVLRRYRDYTKPFGGVQLLMIGDLHQLPPVVKGGEEQILLEHYDTTFFFSSKALTAAGYVPIELNQVYRQTNDRFVQILNKVRGNQLDRETLEVLNSRYFPDFQPNETDGYITLTAHLGTAQDINRQRLNALKQPLAIFKSVVKGDFPVHSYPNEECLELKTGAQVMFIKNDSARERQYYNGKIGHIVKIEDTEIHVQCSGDTHPVVVQPVSWENIVYEVNDTTKEMAEKVTGSFTQYPLRLAWAITIHKSQGLTFEKAIIDVQSAFAAGQVYVALSRCTCFEGLVLRSKIARSSVKTDNQVLHYTKEADRRAPNAAQLRQARYDFQQSVLTEFFQMKGLKRAFQHMTRLFQEYPGSFTPEAITRWQGWQERAGREIFVIADKFTEQLPAHFNSGILPEEDAVLQERLKGSGVYFSKKMEGLLTALRRFPLPSDNKGVLSMVIKAVEELQRATFIQKACMAQLASGFSLTAHLQARSQADAQFAFKLETPDRPTVSASRKLLYEKLDAWRKEAAAAFLLEPHQVLPTKVMTALTEQVPTSTRALRAIEGLGPTRARRFGRTLLALMRDWKEYHTSALIA